MLQITLQYRVMFLDGTHSVYIIKKVFVTLLLYSQTKKNDTHLLHTAHETQLMIVLR